MSIGFINSEKNEDKSLLIDCNFTNAIFEGTTGSGKTTCAILPNIENRIKQNHGIIVYDFKGNLHLQVKYLASKYNKLDKVIEIGKPWGESINLCDYLSLKQIPLIVNNSNDISDSSYWNTASKNLLENLYSIYKNLYYLKNKFKSIDETLLEKLLTDISKPSYKRIFEIVSCVKHVSYFYTDVNFLINKIEEYINICTDSKDANINEVIKTIKENLKSLEIYKKVKEDETGGKNAVVNHLNTILNVVANKDCLNESNLDLIQELRSSKIVIIDVSSFSENILNLLNLSIYSRLQKVNDLSPVTIFIDEAQKILSKDYLPQTDVCRESKFEYIFATQDKILLKNKLGDYKLDELYVNIVDKYSFKSNEHFDLNRFEAINTDTNKKVLAKPLFINKEDLFEAEYNYQKLNDIHLYSDFNHNHEYDNNQDLKYILKYDEKLFEEYKILIELENEEIIESDYIPLVKVEITEDIEDVNSTDENQKKLQEFDIELTIDDFIEFEDGIPVIDVDKD